MKKVLVAEDEESIREFIVINLTRSGYTVEQAENGAVALEKFAKDESGFDVAILDIMMPEMDGLTATRRIRSLNRPDAEQIPIFAVTAGIFPGDIEKIKAAGMTAYLPKPLVWEELIAVLERYCEKADCPLQCV